MATSYIKRPLDARVPSGWEFYSNYAGGGKSIVFTLDPATGVNGEHSHGFVFFSTRVNAYPSSIIGFGRSWQAGSPLHAATVAGGTGYTLETGEDSFTITNNSGGFVYVAVWKIAGTMPSIEITS